MLSTNSLTGATPRLRRAPDCDHNDAPLVLELAAAYGTTLDPWQADALEVGCGVREDGLWAAPTVGLNQARQNGKSVILVVRALAGPLLFGEQTVIVSAHQQKTSRLLFQNVESYFANFADLTKRVRSVSAALGREEIRLKSGAVIAFPARTRQTLRGWSVDCYLADEAQLVTNEQWASAKPAMAARRGAQTWMAGTAPSSLGDAEVFGRLRQAAIAGADASLAWLEFGAEPGCDLDDPEQWAAANPGRVELEAIVSERRELSPEDFAKERLNIWPVSQSAGVLDPDVWAGLVGPGPADGTPPTALGVDASPDRMLSIAAAWLTDAGASHVELVAPGVSDPMAAVQWLAARAGRRIPVVVDGASPAASMIPQLQSQKVKVIVTGAQDMGRACGGLLDDVASARISHAAQEPLNRAVAGSRKRPIGEAGAFGWDRRDGTVWVAPLVAVTLARHGAVTVGRRRTGAAMFA